MASPFDRLMETIRPHLPGAVDQAIRQELFPVCKTFFEESNVWTEDLDFTLPANTVTTEVLPYTGKIVRLISVTKDRAPVYNVTMTDTENGIIQFPYQSTAAGNYVCTVALTVSDPVSRDAFPIVPVDLVSKYWQTLMWGILSNMMAQPKKPYTDVSLASYYANKFNGSSSRAMQAQATGNTYGSQAWRFPQSFNNRRR